MVTHWHVSGGSQGGYLSDWEYGPYADQDEARQAAQEEADEYADALMDIGPADVRRITDDLWAIEDGRLGWLVEVLPCAISACMTDEEATP